jgi:hypothetical protein
MKKSITSKVVTALTLATLTAATLLTPLQANARGKFNCGWVLVSGTPTVGTYAYVCGGKGA